MGADVEKLLLLRRPGECVLKNDEAIGQSACLINYTGGARGQPGGWFSNKNVNYLPSPIRYKKIITHTTHGERYNFYYYSDAWCLCKECNINLSCVRQANEFIICAKGKEQLSYKQNTWYAIQRAATERQRIKCARQSSFTLQPNKLSFCVRCAASKKSSARTSNTNGVDQIPQRFFHRHKNCEICSKKQIKIKELQVKFAFCKIKKKCSNSYEFRF
jgi:hypothetical protein